MAKRLESLHEDEALEDDRLPAELTRPRMADSLIEFKAISLGEEIGHGAFSTVYRGRFAGHDVAIKKMTLKDKDAARYLETELALLGGFTHKHLLRYFGASLHGKEAYIITEYMNGGDLHTIACDLTIPLPWKLRARLACDALEGIAYLHEREVVHRDIKTENILVDDAWRCVIADYGFARKANKSSAMTICGTDEFMAPEVLFGEVYDEKADVFSFGIVLWQLIYRKAPGIEGFLTRSPRTKFQLDFDALRSSAPKDAPESFINLAIACCVYDPSERHSSEEALEWLQSLAEELETADASLLPPSPSEFRKLKHGASTSLSDPSSVLLGTVAPGSPAADPTMVVPTPVNAQ